MLSPQLFQVSFGVLAHHLIAYKTAGSIGGDVTVDEMFYLTEVNYRHENHLVENIAMLSLYYLVRKFSLTLLESLTAAEDNLQTLAKANSTFSFRISAVSP